MCKPNISVYRESQRFHESTGFLIRDVWFAGVFSFVCFAIAAQHDRMLKTSYKMVLYDKDLGIFL